MRKKSSARRAIESARHSTNACVAAWTAASIFSTLAKSTAPGWTPLAGLKTAPLRPEAPLRLGPAALEQAVDDVRSLRRAGGLDEVTWWVGERSAPPDVAARLRALGLEDEPEEMTTLAIESEPGGASDVEVRRVETFDDYLTALEIDWAAFDLPPEQRREPPAAAPAAWAQLVADGRSRGSPA